MQLIQHTQRMNPYHDSALLFTAATLEDNQASLTPAVRNQLVLFNSLMRAYLKLDSFRQ